MTNFEKWKDRIIEFANADEDIAVYNGVPTICRAEHCEEACEIFTTGNCSSALILWLNKEYQERIYPLSDDEYTLLNMLHPSCWIARDKEGYLFVFEERPKRLSEGWVGKTVPISVPSEYFSFIKWESEQPMKVRYIFAKHKKQ